MPKLRTKRIYPIVFGAALLGFALGIAYAPGPTGAWLLLVLIPLVLGWLVWFLSVD